MPCWGVCLLLTGANATFRTQNGPAVERELTWPAWRNACAHARNWICRKASWCILRPRERPGIAQLLPSTLLATVRLFN